MEDHALLETSPESYQQESLKTLDDLAGKAAETGVIQNSPEADVRWKQYRFTVKEVSEADGTFGGYCSVWNTIDSDGEVVDQGSTLRSIKNNPNFVLLWQHQTAAPIGFAVTVSEDQYGLKLKGRIALDCEAGRYAYAMLKLAKDVGGTAKMGLSIGFRAIDTKVVTDQKTGKSHLHFTEIQILETSIVTFQACPPAFVTTIKNKYLHEHPLPASDLDAKGVAAPPEPPPEASLVGQHFLKVMVPHYQMANNMCSTLLAKEEKGSVAELAQRLLETQTKEMTTMNTWLGPNNYSSLPGGDNYQQAADSSELDTKTMSTSTTPNPGNPLDFDSSLQERRRQQQLVKSRRDIEGALYDTLTAVHGSDLPTDNKKSLIAETYQKHAAALADWHGESYLGERHKSFSAELLRKEDDTVSEQWRVKATTLNTEQLSVLIGTMTSEQFQEFAKATKGKVSAAMAASLCHAHDLMNSATDLHTKAKLILKDAYSNDSSPEVPGSGMGLMSDTAPLAEKTTEEKDVLAKSDTDATTVADGVTARTPVPAADSDSGIHSLLADMAAATKARKDSL